MQTTLALLQPLLPELAARAGDMEAARRLPADLAQKLAAAGVFRMVTPRTFGGLELSPREIVEVTEAAARANASAGWCVMIAATTALNAAYMAPEYAREIYADPLTITGGVFAPMGKAVVEGDHYRVSGRWQWGSGSANCSWLCGGCTVWEADEMKRLPSGAPDTRMMVFPASEVTLHDTWHVMGLKGTGSGDIEVKDILVPRGRSVSLVADAPRESGALFKFPAFGLLALGVSAVALGNARGALDAFHALATVKKSQGSSKTLSERQAMQADYARCEAQWRAARAYLFAEIDRVWTIAQGDGAIPMEARADLRLACTHMTRTGADICRTLYDLGGGAALFEASDLQRRFRDAHAITQHIVTAPSTLELTGRILFGLPTDGAMV
ncbi:putative hydrolase NrgC [Hyphomonas neptunium ATCC 15444]|uniref:Putative hydrolase NrgC n=2 Tax=Hyphomonas TaxID=85 RepID=Q0BX43_HYPNA|nr:MULTISPECIES: acyl-CoA dehydrogenase family protein [Hyphomonas]ABI78410.1 putative hydrolase NrgC [Hyphomonas neptunium ATCC 15444]